jgi:AcrR family transcriptional regulator
VVTVPDATADDGAAPPAEERILLATIDALTQLDPSAVTIKRICRTAQVTPPTIYYHFGSKEGLVAAAVERLAAQWLAVIEAAVGRAGTLPDALARATQVWVASITAPSRPIAVYAWATLLLARSSEPSRLVLSQTRDRARTRIAEVVAVHVGPSPVVDVIAGLVVDAVLASAVQYELDQDADALSARLEGLSTAVKVLAAQPAG